MQRGGVDDRIHALQRYGQNAGIGEISHVTRGCKRTAVDAHHIVAGGQRAKDGATDPA